MAFFGSNDKANTVTTGSKNSTTIITGCMNIKGNIQGCGTIHIDGKVDGDIQVKESVVIGQSGSVKGYIKSKKVIVSGTVEGSIECDVLEVTQTGTISNKIIAKEMSADGKIDAIINVQNAIHITDNANIVTEEMLSKNIVVNGKIDGNVTATELLEINKNGRVKGKMVVKKIKVSEGGLMLGTMLTYDEEYVKRFSKQKPQSIETKEEKEEEKES